MFLRKAFPNSSNTIYYAMLTTSRWFSFVFTYDGPNKALLGFYNAIILVMQTGFAVCGFVTLILNLVLPEEIDDEDAPELTADTSEDEHDTAEWDRIKNVHGHGKTVEEARSSSEITPVAERNMA